MGKAYANRKKESERPIRDFYQTPKTLVTELLNARDEKLGSYIFDVRNSNDKILDPCCGKYAIGNTIRNHNENCATLNITEKDIMYGDDFLIKDKNGNIIIDDDEHWDCIIMNPPFKLFNDFVNKSKIIADKVYCIGKMDYFCTHDRNVENLWEHLEWVLPFDRKVAYDKPFREDGKVEVGMLNSCWLVWNKHYNGYPKIKVLDVDKYVLRKSEK